jgi:hypothetical protein
VFLHVCWSYALPNDSTAYASRKRLSQYPKRIRWRKAGYFSKIHLCSSIPPFSSVKSAACSVHSVWQCEFFVTCSSRATEWTLGPV